MTVETPLTRTIDLRKEPLRVCCNQALSRRLVILLDNNVPENTVEIRDDKDRLKATIINVGREDETGDRSRTKL